MADLPEGDKLADRVQAVTASQPDLTDEELGDQVTRFTPLVEALDAVRTGGR